MTIKLEASWRAVLKPEFDKEYMKQLKLFLVEEQQHHTVYPPNSEIFTAFEQTPFDNVRVVILGQDPYHGPGEAHGLSFSVKKGIRIPPSLRNIYKELQSDLGIVPAQHGYLIDWAKQGVLLLNTVLTVRHKTAKKRAPELKNRRAGLLTSADDPSQHARPSRNASSDPPGVPAGEQGGPVQEVKLGYKFYPRPRRTRVRAYM